MTGGYQAAVERIYQTAFLIPLTITGEISELAVGAWPKAVSLDWLDQLNAADIHAAASAEHIAPITAGFNALLQQAVPLSDYRFIDNLLMGLQPERMRADVMVAVLRTLFPVRDFLPHYRQLRDKVTAELSSRNMDTPRILRGLI